MGCSCVLCLQRPLPLTLTNDTVLGEIILVSFDGESEKSVVTHATHARHATRVPLLGPRRVRTTTRALPFNLIT